MFRADFYFIKQNSNPYNVNKCSYITKCEITGVFLNNLNAKYFLNQWKKKYPE